uniref:apolipoprotein L6-like isoform X1 n=1 Tax=Ictidomys tridecemlineatus TaxID=43179 RepID=UPI00068167B1|nr:apolipoprotein L6-like isoform X1 [Ictidomys tridecemlineatus]XP_040134614.1 apolipoprotein L6-like isoform X1 [Ictidomys tridecemlineatus]
MVFRRTSPFYKGSPDEDLSDEEKHFLKYHREQFLKDFPKWKQEQEKTIRELRARADEVDATHEQTNKINVVAHSTAVFSRAMSLLGIALAPLTTRGSLTLSAAGKTLGAAAEVTSDVTNLIEGSCNKKVKAQATGHEPTSEPELEQVDEKSILTAMTNIMDKFQDTSKSLRKSRRAYRVAQAKPSLAKAAKYRLTGGKVSDKTSKYVQKAFDGTPLGMTKSALLEGGAETAVHFVRDLCNLSDTWKKLKGGERAQQAKELRAQAQELEELVTQYSHHYERLQQKLYFRSMLLRFVLLCCVCFVLYFLPQILELLTRRTEQNLLSWESNRDSNSASIRGAGQVPGPREAKQLT